MKIIHLMAHLTARGRVDLRDQRIATRLWKFLRKAFPACLSAVFMPTHPHLVAVVTDPDAARITFARVVGAAVRGHGRWTWERVPEPELLESKKRILSCIHYVNMNPVYARLVDEPLEWKWGTHRDVVGATVDPWVTPDRLHSFLRQPRDGFETWFHATMTNEPKLDLRPTPFPEPAPPRRSPVVSLEEIRHAALNSTRGMKGDVTSRGRARALFMALARDQGWNDNRALADFCHMTPAGAAVAGRSVSDREMAALRLCLGDPRLGVPVLAR